MDPFGLEEEKKDAADEVPEPVTKQPPPAAKGKAAAAAEPPAEEEVDDGSFKYRLGKKQYKDSEQGDLGCLYKRPEVMPRLFFIRASFCSKLNA